MKHIGIAVLAALLWAPPARAADRPMRVVATLATFADLAKTIGGAHVEVDAVASPKFNAHFIEPRPSDVRRVKRAELFIHAGLDLEAWRGPLLDAAGNTGIMPGRPGELDLSRGIALLEVPDRPVTRAEGDIHLFGNPHYWTNPENARIMARSIAEKLTERDPANAAAYAANLDAFLRQLDAKLPEWREALQPHRGAELVAYHNEWIYLLAFAGLRAAHFLEPKPGIPPTPRQVEFLEAYIPQHGIQAIVQASYVPPHTAQKLAERTGAKVVILCHNVGELKACADTLAMYQHNIDALARALQP